MTIISNIHVGLPVWQLNHVYTVGQRISNDSAPSKAYQCTIAGTSQNLTGAGPKGLGLNIIDGTAHFKYLSVIDYTLEQSWWNALPATLVDSMIGRVWNDAPRVLAVGEQILNTNNYIPAVGTFTITLTPAPSEGYRDKGSSAVAFFNTTTGVSYTAPTATGAGNYNLLFINCPNVVIDGIQIQDPNGASNISILYANAPGFVWGHNIIDSYSQGYGVVGATFNKSSTVYDSIFVERAGPSAVGGTVNTGSDAVSIANNTFVALNGATLPAYIANNAVAASIENNVFIGYTNPISNANVASLTIVHCAFDVAFGVLTNVTNGAGNLFSVVPSSVLINALTDLRLKAGSVCIDAGIVVTQPPTSFFTVSGGLIKDINGVTFTCHGVSVSEGEMAVAVTNALGQPLTSSFPKMNLVRLACFSYQAPSAYTTFVQYLTGLNIVVIIEDHSTVGGGGGTNYTGTQLTNELNWYSNLATAFKGNPYVWFGMPNEPPNTTGASGTITTGSLTTWQVQIYNNIRSTGNNTIIELELYGGGNPTWMGANNTSGNYPNSSYATMSNVIWGPHFYNWLTNYSTSISTSIAMINNLVSLCNQIPSADGTMPVAIFEFGVSSTGTTSDAGGQQSTQAVFQSGIGAVAWGWGPYQGLNSMTDSSYVLNTWGSSVASWLASLPVPPTPSFPLLLSDDIFYTHRPMGAAWDIGAVEYVPSSIVQLPSLHASAVAIKSYALYASPHIASLSCVSIIARIMQASATNYATGIDCIIYAYQEKLANAIATTTLLRAVSAASQSNVVVGMPSLAWVSAIGSASFALGGYASILLPTVSAYAVARQENMMSSVAITMTTMQSFASGPNQAIGVSHVWINAVGSAVTPNAASSFISFMNISTTNNILQEEFVNAVSSIGNIVSVPIVNPSSSISIFSSIQAVISATQEIISTLVCYVTGVQLLSVSYQEALISSSIANLFIATNALALQEDLASGAQNSFTILSANAGTGQESFVGGVYDSINISSICQAGQEQFMVPSVTNVSYVTTIINASSEVLAYASAPIHVTVQVAITEELLIGCTLFLPSLTCRAVGGMEGLASGVQTAILPINSAAIIDQYNLSIGASIFASLLSKATLAQEDQAIATSNASYISASIQAGQGNAFIAIMVVSTIASVASVNNPLAVSSIGNISVGANVSIVQENFVTADTLTTSVFDFVQAVQEQQIVAHNTFSTYATASAHQEQLANVSASLPTVVLNAQAYRGWVGTGQGTVTISTSSVVDQTYGASSVNTLSINMLSAASESVLAQTTNTFIVSAQISGLIGQAAFGTIFLPTLTASANAIVSNVSIGFSPVLLSAFGFAFLSELWQGNGTLTIQAKSAVYPSPFVFVESEDIIYVDEDDRLICVDE